MSSEVARILEEGIAASFPLDMKQRRDAIDATMYKGQFRALESWVLRTINKKDEPDVGEALRFLQDGVVKLQQQRQQAAENMETERQERQTRLEESTGPGLGVFAALDSGYAKSTPGRLSKVEWRRRNLRQALAVIGHGAQSRLAESMKCSRGYVSQLLADPGDKKHRNITTSTARKIEVALQLEKGTLDEVPPVSDVDELLYSAAELAKNLKKIGRV